MLSCFSSVWLFVTLWTDCSPPGSSVHETLQTRLLEWVAVPSSRGPPLPQGLLPSQELNLRFLHCRWIHYRWATGEAPFPNYIALFSFRCNGQISPRVVVNISALPKSELWLLLHMEQDTNSGARTTVIQTSYWCQLRSILNSYVYTGSSKLPLKT